MRHVVSSHNSTAPPSSSSPQAGSVAAQKRWQGQRRGLAVLLLFYGGVLAAVGIANARGPERWLWSSLNQYLPQWLWGIPALVLLAATWRLLRWCLWLPVIYLGAVLGPLMGGRWPVGSGGSVPPSGLPLRVMTYNVNQHTNASGVLAQMEEVQPDLLFLQEADKPLDAVLTKLHGWNVVGPYNGCLIASRWPLSQVQVRQLPLSPEWRKYLRCQVTVEGRPITLVDLHLDTPRKGLEPLIAGGVHEIATYEKDMQARLARSSAVADEMRREPGPLLVAGDFNAPVQSLVCRALTDIGLRDAFSTAGRGYGYTYGHELRFRHSYVRIDHVLVSSQWQVTGCQAGSAEGSDHRPVIADLVLLPDI